MPQQINVFQEAFYFESYLMLVLQISMNSEDIDDPRPTSQQRVDTVLQRMVSLKSKFLLFYAHSISIDFFY